MITTTSLTPCQTYIANVDRVCWFSSSGSLQSKAIQKYNYDFAESTKSAGFQHPTRLKRGFMSHILSRQDTQQSWFATPCSASQQDRGIDGQQTPQAKLEGNLKSKTWTLMMRVSTRK